MRRRPRAWGLLALYALYPLAAGGGLLVPGWPAPPREDGPPFDCPATPFAFSTHVFLANGPMILTEPANWSYGVCPPQYTGGPSLRGAIVIHVDPEPVCPLEHSARAAVAEGALVWLQYSSESAGLKATPGKRGNEFSALFRVEKGDGIIAASIDSACADALVEWLRDMNESGAGARRARLSASVSPTPSRWSAMWSGGAWVLWRIVTAFMAYAIMEFAALRLHLLLSSARSDEPPSVGPRLFLALLLGASAIRLLHVAIDPMGSSRVLPVEWDGLLGALSWALHALGIALFFRHYVSVAVLVSILPRSRPRTLGLWALLVLLPALLIAVGLALALARCAGLRWTKELDHSSRALRAIVLPLAQGLSGIWLDVLIHRQMSSCPSPLFIELIMKAKWLNFFLLVHALAASALAYLSHAPAGDFILGLLTHVAQVGAAYVTISSVRPIGARAVRVGPAGMALSLGWRLAVRAARKSPCAKVANAVAPLPADGPHSLQGVGGMRASSGQGANVSAHFSSTLPPHLRLGVTTAFMREFADKYGCDMDTKSFTMRELALRTTTPSMLSLAEVSVEESSANGYPRVGRASLFVSHAHACSYLRMVDAIEAHLELHGMAKEWTYVWVDIFCIRQQCLHSEIAHIGQIELELGHVVVVLDPWDKPVCLTRVWCEPPRRRASAARCGRAERARRARPLGAAAARSGRQPPSRAREGDAAPSASASLPSFAPSAPAPRARPRVQVSVRDRALAAPVRRPRPKRAQS